MVGSNLRFLIGLGRTGVGIAVGILIVRYVALRKGKMLLHWTSAALCFLSLFMASGAFVYDFYSYEAELSPLPYVQVLLLIGAVFSGLIGFLYPSGAKAR